MKKYLIIVLLSCITLSASAEKLTKEQKIDKKINATCNCLFEQACKTKHPDDKIIALECLYEQNKKYKRSNAETVAGLYNAYSEKYDKSLENPKYLKKMYKYSIMALDENTEDSELVKKAFYLSWGAKNKKNMNRAYEYLNYKDAKGAKELKTFLEKKNKEEQETIIKRKREAELAEKKKLQDYFTMPVYDRESGTFYSREQKWQLDLNRSKTNRSQTTLMMNNSSGSYSSSDSNSSSSSGYKGW